MRRNVKTLDGLYGLLGQLIEERADIISVSKCYDGSYDVNSRASSEASVIKADYERLRLMEKRINVYPDLRKAVRAAMEHDDRLIENYLNRFHEALQESINNRNKDVMVLEALKTITLEILELANSNSPAGSSTANNRRNSE